MNIKMIENCWRIWRW